MTFWELANEKMVWILVIIALLFVFFLSLYFFIKARKRCIELGIESRKIQKIIMSSVTLSIVPSLSIIIGLISLSTLLGKAWSWFRLSVVGSVGYELLAADLAAKALGVENLGSMRDKPAEYFVTVMFVMSIGILSNNIFNLFFMKKLSNTLTEFNKKNGGKGALITGSFISTMIMVFFLVQVFGGTVPLLTILTSLAFAYVLTFICRKFKLAWFAEFIMALTLLFGMAAGVLWNRILT